MFPELRARILDADPLITLAAFSFHGLTEHTHLVREVLEDEPTLPPHVELLHALLIQHKREKYPDSPPSAVQLGELHRLLLNTVRTFGERRAADIEADAPEDELNRRFLIEEIRINTTGVRNWGHADQMLRIVTSLFEQVEEEIEQRLKIKVGHLLQMYRNIGLSANKRLQEHARKLRPIHMSNTIRAMAEAYVAAFEPTSGVEDLVRIAEAYKFDNEYARSVFTHLADRWATEIYTVSLEDFVAAYPVPIDPEALGEMLNALSLNFGDLAEHDPEHFFMGNPVWERPFIRLDDERYFVPVFGSLVSFCLEQVEALLRPHTDLYNRYLARRGPFLEEETQRLFKAAFPDAQVLRGVYWEDPETGDRIENDIVVILDSHLIIAEEKGGRITAHARRGAEGRVQKTVDDLLIKPSTQAQRFAAYLRKYPGVHVFEDRKGKPVEIDARGVQDVMVLCVTLDRLTLNSHGSSLQRAGFVEEELDLAPSISLADLETVLTMLRGQCERLHYLVQRSEFERSHGFLADEMDLLAFYLESGLNLRGPVETGGFVELWGQSHMLAPYFQQLFVGRRPVKPKREMTPWWAALVRRVEERKMTGWTRIGLVLLNATLDEQRDIEHTLRREVREAQRTLRDGVKWGVYTLGYHARGGAVAALLYRPTPIQELNLQLVGRVGQAIEEAGTKEVVVIGFDVKIRDYPCSLIAWAHGLHQ